MPPKSQTAYPDSEIASDTAFVSNGEEVRVDFVKYLREVRPFKTSRALIEQMKEDVEQAQKALGAL